MEKLIICGLGVRIPEETTLESLQALGDCRVVYSDLSDKKALSWLAGYCKAPIKTPASAAEILNDAAKNGGVGVAVWGHPQSSSRLTRELELAAQKAGVAYRAYGAISPIGSVFARSISFLGGDYGYQGIQSYDLETLLEDRKAATPELPLVLYSEKGGSAQWSAALKALAPGYPKGHKARLFGAGGTDVEAPMESHKPAGSCVMLIPPAKPLTSVPERKRN